MSGLVPDDRVVLVWLKVLVQQIIKHQSLASLVKGSEAAGFIESACPEREGGPTEGWWKGLLKFTTTLHSDAARVRFSFSDSKTARRHRSRSFVDFGARGF